MTPIALLAAAALSALGRGRAAYAAGVPGETARSGLARAASGLFPRGAPEYLTGRVPRALLDADGARDPAEALVLAVARDLARELDARRRGWRRARVAILLGTSSGAMTSIEAALAARAAGRLDAELAERASYFAPAARVAAALGVPDAPVYPLLGACASSTLALGLAARLLEAGECELAIAGGYDALAPLVAAGFHALGALTPSEPRPFASARDGLALGEGAALIALGVADGAPSLGTLLGFGASSDAVHVTAPDRTGSGLACAAEAALRDAGIGGDGIDLVSAHATSTPYNDAAETRAIARSVGHAVRVHAFKAAIGHTLGAAGALETLAACDALERGLLPGTPGAHGAGADPDAAAAGLALAAEHGARPLRAALKLSSAFGGVNAALVLAPAARAVSAPSRPRVAVALHALGEAVRAAEPERVLRLAPQAGLGVARADSVSELALAAVARLCERLAAPLPRGTAIVVGSALATLEPDELFDRRRRQHEPLEPRRFPPTSPNLSAGLCSIVFGLHGPAFAVGGGAGAERQALVVSHALVAAGDAEAALVVLIEDAGPVSLDLAQARGVPAPLRAARALLLAPASDFAGFPTRPALSRATLDTCPTGPMSDWRAWAG